MPSGRAAAAVALGLFALCLLAGGGSEAAASPIQLNFVAVATAPGAGGPEPGTVVTGSLRFDPDTLTAVPGAYQFSSGEALLQMSGVPSFAEAPLGFITITDGPGEDFWMAQSPTPPANSPGYLDVLFALSDSTGTAVSSTDYFTPDSLAPWTSGTVSLIFRLRGVSPVNLGYFTLTGLSVAAPEPTSEAAVALALCLLGARRAFAR